jgi:hypothetical protein
MSRMNRSAAVIAALLLATPAGAGELVSPPGPGEQETAQAGGGTGRFSVVGALRCPGGQAMVGVRTATGPLLNFLELACAPVSCEGGQCRWRPETMAWAAPAGERTGAEAILLCSPLAVISGFRAAVAAVAGGAAVQSLAVQCAPLVGIAPMGGFAVGPAEDPRVTRRFVPAGRPPDRAVTGACRDRGAAAFSVAVGAYPRGAGGQGEHVRALSLFCPGLVQ